MGSPLTSVLANLFMGHHERIWLQQYNGPAVYFYRRYVDDTFCLFNNEKDALEFFQYINGKHSNIRFTMETEVNHRPPFLDVLLDNVILPNLSSHLFSARAPTQAFSPIFQVFHLFPTNKV